MKHLFVFASLLMVLVFAAPCFAGHIQVKCEPGIEIFLDGELKGVSSSDVGGLILQDVLPGSHRLRAVKAGFTPREETVTISGSEVKVWNIEKFVPQVRVSQEGQAVQAKIEQKTGTLVLQTLPVEAKIEIPSLGVNETKNKDIWKVESLPEGEYDVRVSGMGKSLSYRVRITTNDNTKLLFNLLSEKVEDQNEAERARVREQREIEQKRALDMAETQRIQTQKIEEDRRIRAKEMERVATLHSVVGWGVFLLVAVGFFFVYRKQQAWFDMKCEQIHKITEVSLNKFKISSLQFKIIFPGILIFLCLTVPFILWFIVSLIIIVILANWRHKHLLSQY